MAQLIDYLQKLNNSDEYPLHMPGHKRNGFVPFLETAYGVDITEIEGSDNLYEAEGILKEAMERAARVYGADRTMFLVNGSTVGILSAITGLTKKGDTILMARNCHKAVYHAVELRELHTEYVFPKNWEYCDIAGQITVKSIREKVEANTDICLVVLTSPTYEGVTSPIRGIADYLHKKNIPLLVDEAHGAHFPFSDNFPESAVAAGADVVIQSMHKTLPTFTQSALMHIGKDAPNKEKIMEYVSYYQTSSPSYLFMAGMDACIDKLEKEGCTLWDDFFAYRKAFLDKTKSLRHLKVICEKTDTEKTIQDPGKIVISVKHTSINGKELQNRLLNNYKIQLEMATESYVLAIFTMSDTEEGWKRLAEALLEIDATIETKAEYNEPEETFFALQTKLTIYEARQREWEYTPLQPAKNRISAGYINLYPPGIPLIVPGEVITQTLIDRIEKAIAINLHVQGFEEGLVRVLK